MASQLSRTEVCQLLGVSPKSLYLWERDGRIPTPRRDRRNWRSYSPTDVAAIRQYLGTDQAVDTAPARKKSTQHIDGLSARNQLVGTIIGVKRSGLLCEVVVRLGDGQEITSIITESSGNRLGLRKGREVTAIIKATEVMLMR